VTAKAEIFKNLKTIKMEINKTKIGKIAEKKLAEIKSKILNCNEIELPKLKRFENY